MHREDLTDLSRKYAEGLRLAEAASAPSQVLGTGTCELRLSLRVLLCPLPSCRNSLSLVLLPRLSYVVRKRVVRIRGAEEGLD